MFKITFVDGYIVKPLSPGLPDPNLVLSKYFGQLVHLIMKGPKRRACDPTLSFPDLNTSAVYQDGFPLLVASEESLEHVRKVINNYARQGVIGSMDSSWETGQIEMERSVSDFPSIDMEFTSSRYPDSDQTLLSAAQEFPLLRM